VTAEAPGPRLVGELVEDDVADAVEERPHAHVPRVRQLRGRIDESND
jgi:hypothetical protein